MFGQVWRNGALVEFLVTDGAICQLLGVAQPQIENESSFMKSDVFVSESRRSPAPSARAAEGAAKHSRIAGIADRHRRRLRFHSHMVVHQEIGGRRIGRLHKSPCLQTPLNGVL